MNQEYKNYPVPKTSEQEVLLHLIVEGNVSIMDFGWLSGFRTRISQLQTHHGLFLERIFLNRRNKFGNLFRYAKHTLPENQKETAIKLYNQLNKQ